MARPKSNGLLYFPFDTSFFFDRKIKTLKGRYGADGISVYLYILTEIYRDCGYYMKVDGDFYDTAADDLNMSPDKVNQIVLFLSERSMFSEQLLRSDDVLSGAGIQRRFQEAMAERGKKREIEVDKNIWLLSESETKPFIKVIDFLSFSEKNEGFSLNNDSFSREKCHKEKKRKVNNKESKERKQNSFDEIIAGFTKNEKLRELIGEHLKIRKMRKAALTDFALRLWLDQLDRYGKNDAEKIEIVSRSIQNGWIGVFPLPKENGLNNFRQDMPDLKEIERKIAEGV